MNFASIPISDWVEVKVLIDNAVDEFLPSADGVQRYRFIRPGHDQLPPPIRAEHGLSLLIRWKVEAAEHCLLFDFGLSEDALMENIGAMGEGLTDIEAMVLSHGHWDHFGGLARLRLNEPNLALFCGPEALLKHRIGPSGHEVDVGQIKEEWLSRNSIKAVEIDGPKEVLPGALLTGPIPRQTSFEGGSGPFQVETAEGWVPDHFPGEMGLVFRTNQGLVVFSGCAHAGIINTTRYARELVGEERIHAVMGGFHLVTSPDEVIEATIDGFRDLDPEVLVPMHCTGHFANMAIAQNLKKAYQVSSVGTTWRFPLPRKT